LFDPAGDFPGSSRWRKISELSLDRPNPEFELIELKSPTKRLNDVIKDSLISFSPA
jgi:hypothetical protein